MHSLIFVLSITVAAVRAGSLPLSTLVSECHLARAQVYRFGALQAAAVLDCGCRPHVITSPVSLEGLVEISTPETALEFVRFFSSTDTYDLFQLSGMVEIAGFGDLTRTKDGRLLVDDKFKPTFGHQFRAPVVVAETQFGERRFRIQRVIVSTDGRVYELDEYVSQAGVYRILNRKLLLRNAATIGILHFGDV
jgi:hypothetical protein